MLSDYIFSVCFVLKNNGIIGGEFNLASKRVSQSKASKGRLWNSKPGKTWETIPTSPHPRLGIFQKLGMGLKVQTPKIYPVLSTEVFPKALKGYL